MTETDINNYTIIDGLVKNHFNLGYKGYEDFHKLLWNKNNERIIDPIFKELLGKDLRYSIPISRDMYPAIDEGWELFKKKFNYLFANSDFNIQYKNYKENSIDYHKNKLKLFKAVKKYYKENERALSQFVYNHTNSYFDERKKEDIFDEAFTEVVNEIGTKKIPNKDMTIVLSLNYADWFLCSTSESWESCLNLESEYEDCFWSGLPGLIGDPNRMMFYITNGKKKEYNGIKVDSVTARTWGILTDDSDIIHPVLSYPIELLEGNILQRVFKDLRFLHEEDAGWISKYPLTIIRNTLNQSAFIYQDSSFFSESSDEYYLEGGSSGSSIIDSSGYISDGSPYYYTEGLSNLIHLNEDISNYNEDAHVCEVCNERLDEDDAYFAPNGEVLCSYCFSENYSYCESCNETYDNEDMRQIDGEYVCESCFDDIAVYCEDCSQAVLREDAVLNANDEPICPSCLEKYTECKECGDFVKTDDLNDEGVCSYCVKQGVASGQ